jgi:hypothetical protein
MHVVVLLYRIYNTVMFDRYGRLTDRPLRDLKDVTPGRGPSGLFLYILKVGVP